MTEIVDVIQTTDNTLNNALKKINIDNPYIKSILERHSSGLIKNPPFFGDLISNHKKIQDELDEKVKYETPRITNPQTSNDEIFNIIINSLLHEKLIEHKQLKQSNFFKWINFLLIFVIPLITNILQYIYVDRKSEC